MIWDEKMAHELLKKILAVNYFWFLNIPTWALWTLIISPILWQIGKSSYLFEKRTKVKNWICPVSGSILQLRSVIFNEQTYLSDL